MASGLIDSEGSVSGFPFFSRRAGLGDAQMCLLYRIRQRPPAIARGRFGPQEPSEARLAGPDYPFERRWSGHLGDHGRGGQDQDLRLALARTPPPVNFPLHAHLLLLAQCGRGLLRQTDTAQAQARRLPLRRRPASRDQPSHPTTQRLRPEAIRLEGQARPHHRCAKSRVPNVGINPLVP